MITDSISDMIVRIKNASDSRKDVVSMPYSKFREAVALALEKGGYVKGVAKKGKKVAKTLEVGLIYVGKEPRIQGVDRVSKPSKRLYQKSRDIRKFKNGFGNVILSTPKGILSDFEAKKQNVGGEILFKIW